MGGIITNLIGQGLGQKAQSAQQDAQDINQQLQTYGYILQDPDAPLPLKNVAQQKVLGLAQKHGGKQAREAMPMLGQYLTQLAAPSIMHGMQQQRAAAGAQDRFGSQFRQYVQQPSDVHDQLGAPSPPVPPAELYEKTPPVQAQPTDSATANVKAEARVPDAASSNVPWWQRGDVQPDPTLGTGQYTERQVGPYARLERQPPGAAAGEPSAAPALPSLRALAGMESIPDLATSTALPTPHGIRQHIANALTRFAEGMGEVSPARKIQLQTAANIQEARAALPLEIAKARALLPLQIEQARQLGNFQLAQSLQQEQALQNARMARINQFYAAPETRQMFYAAGLTDRDIAERRLDAIGQALGVKPTPESPVYPYTLTNEKGERVNLLADKAGFVEIDAVTAERLGDLSLAGKRVKADQIPGWNLEGKTSTARTTVDVATERLQNALIASGQAKTPEEAKKKAAEMQVARQQRLSTGLAGEPMTEAEMLPIVQADIATGQRTSFGRGDNPNTILYQKVRARELAKNVGLALDERATFKGLSSAVSTMETRHAQLESNEGIARYNLTKALELSKQVPRGQARLWNDWKRKLEGAAIDYPELRQFSNYVEAGTLEIAQLLSSASGGAVTTDSAKEHARAMLSPGDPSKTFDAAVEGLLDEAAGRIRTTGEVIDNLHARIRAIPGGGAGGAADNAPTPTSTATRDPRLPALPKQRGQLISLPEARKYMEVYGSMEAAQRAAEADGFRIQQ